MTKQEQIAQLKAAREIMKAQQEKRLGASTSSPEAKSFKTLESKACAKYGAKSLDEVITKNSSSRSLKALGREDREALLNLKEAVDVTVMTAAYFGTSIKNSPAYESTLVPAIKAFGINVGEVGYDWIPTGVSESYVEEYNLDRKVAALFTEIKMPTNPYKFPVQSNGIVARKIGENTQLSPKDQFSSSAITFSAVKISNQLELPEEITEDSAVDIMKVVREQLLQGEEKAIEIAILEGDADGTHQHTNSQLGAGAPAVDSAERLFDGLRKRALAAGLKVDQGGTAPSEAKLSDLRKIMGKYGVRSSELAMIPSIHAYNGLMLLPSVRTVDKYGPQATVLAGELAKYDGIPVIVSEFLRDDTDATGVNGATPSQNTRASIILVNRKRFMTAVRRGTMVKVENNRTFNDVWDMVSFSRKAFDGVLKADGSNGATETSVALLYNVA